VVIDEGKPPSPRPGPEHERLGVFIGTWRTSGRTVPGPSGPALDIVGTDTYEWLPGRFFVVHRVDVRLGGERMQAIEIIGYDASSGAYTTRSFDSTGNRGAYRVTVRERVWTFAGETERATATVDADGDAISVRWERARNGSAWCPWMDLELVKMA
jgi:hypothetical protein